MKAVIHYRRINKPEVIYTESYASDDGLRLDTETILDREFSRRWIEKDWQPQGLLRAEPLIASVRKHHFYREWFSIMELRSAGGGLLGFYCDLLTPLEKRAGEYYLLDLMLDLWIAPDGSMRELDWDEFDACTRQGKILPEHQRTAVATLSRLTAETRAGTFPWAYLPDTISFIRNGGSHE